MLFTQKIKVARVENGLLQKQLASALKIDVPMYSRIERGDRQAKREQVEIIAQMLDIDKNELVKLWLADKVYEVVSDEVNAQDILNVVNENIVRYGQEI